VFEPDIDFSRIPVGLPNPRVSAPTPAPVAPVAPITEVASGGYANLGSAINDYKSSLSSGANYSEIDDVDLVGDYYDDIFKNTLGSEAGVFSAFDIIGGEGTMSGAGTPSDRIQIDSDSYFANVNAPEYLRTFTAPATQETAVSAYQSISGLQDSEDIAATLSAHYGYNITPSEQTLGRFGGNLQSHTGSSKDRLAEFHSFVEPILSEQIPYLQAVEGLTYENALIEAYKRDPMLQSLYAKYDVNPIRQTEDGSTYLYDPFTFGEIRTLEVKDPDISDIAGAVLPAIAASIFLNPFVGTLASSAATAIPGVTAGTTTANLIASGLEGAAMASITGEDPLEGAITRGLLTGVTETLGDIPLISEATTDQLINADGTITVLERAVDPVLTVGDIVSTGAGLTGAGDDMSVSTPVFNPNVINLAASAIDELEQEDRPISAPVVSLDDVIESIEDSAAPPTTPLTVPELAGIPVTPGVEPIEPPEEFEEDIAPPVVVRPEETVDTGGGGGEAPAPDTVFTQEDINSQIAEAVANATEGLFTSDQVDQATQEAIDSLPEDTTEFSQDDLDKAVSDALADAKIDSDAALAGAYEVFQENLPEDTTEFSQDDVDRFIREALEAIPEDVTPFNQEDIDTAVQDAINALPEDVTEFNQEDVDSAVKEALAELQADFTEERTGFESTIEALESDVEQTEEELAGATQEIIDLTNLISNLETTSSDLRTTLESTQEDLAGQREVSAAQQEDIDTLNTSVSDLTTTVENLQTSLQEANDARETAVEQGNQALADALEQYQELLQDQITTSEQILEDAIAAGETALSDAVAAGNAAVAEAVAAGEALGEARYGEGLGTGRGQGAGAGIGAGLGLGLLAGMAGGMGGGTAYTPPDFEDYQFRKTYQAPELLELAPQYAGYQAPTLQGLFRGFI